jgi:hypothetical protein
MGGQCSRGYFLYWAYAIKFLADEYLYFNLAEIIFHFLSYSWLLAMLSCKPFHTSTQQGQCLALEDTQRLKYFYFLP